ncbi:hypothetical protein, partial [Burkholderia glumae]|uniref:hypothetical protein n=1 Tax=Burkholderia glumae TaxID=337 RepID=UPI001E2D8B76
SGENLVAFLFMAPFSQESEPPQNSVRFRRLLADPRQSIRPGFWGAIYRPCPFRSPKPLAKSRRSYTSTSHHAEKQISSARPSHYAIKLNTL